MKGQASGMTVRPKHNHGYWDGEDQERSRFVKGTQGVQSWLFKFEVPKVRLSGQLHANTWIQREDQPRDLCHQYTNVIKTTRLDRITWEILQGSFSKQYLVFTMYQHCGKSFTAMYSIFLITLR